MSLIKMIKNIISTDNTKSKKEVTSNEDFLRTLVVYNSKRKLVILISFTKNYFADIMEFSNACNLSGVDNFYRQSAYDEEVKEPEEKYVEYTFTPLLTHRRYYLLISGSSENYISLINKIDLDNIVLKAVLLEIYSHRPGVEFKSLTDSLVIDNDFASNVSATFDDSCKVSYEDENHNVNYVEYDDIAKIKSNIPECFTKYDLTFLIQYYQFDKAINHELRFTIREMIHILQEYIKKHPDSKSAIEEILFNSFTNSNFFNGKITQTRIFNLLNPLYMQTDDDMMAGDVSDESLDQIFREQYDRFNAVYNPLTVYTSIDEKIDDNAETENMRPTDILNDLPEDANVDT